LGQKDIIPSGKSKSGSFYTPRKSLFTHGKKFLGQKEGDLLLPQVGWPILPPSLTLFYH